MSAYMSVIAGSIVMVVLICAKDVYFSTPSSWARRSSIHFQVYGYIFSDEEEVIRLVSQVMPLVASFQVRPALLVREIAPWGASE